MTITILFELIKSLTKEEKRFFKLHSQLQGKHKKYILLFDFLESQTAFSSDLLDVFQEENPLEKNVEGIRNYLGKAILSSLVAFQLKKTVEYDFLQAQILFERGFFETSLKFIQKTKTKCLKNNEYEILLKCIELEIKCLLTKKTSLEKTQTVLNKKKEIPHILEQLSNKAVASMLYQQIVEHLIKFVLDTITEEEDRLFWQESAEKVSLLEKKSHNKDGIMQLLMAKSIIYAKLNNVEAIRKCVDEAVEIIDIKPKPVEIISSINYLASLMGSCLQIGLKAESDLLLNKVSQLNIKTPKIKFHKQNVFLQMLLFYATMTQDNSKVFPHLAELKTFLAKNIKQDKVSNLLKQTLMYFFMQKQYENCIDFAQICLNKNSDLPTEHPEYLNVWLPYIVSHIELGNYDLALNLTQNVYRTLKRHKLVGEKKRPILLAIQRFLKSKHTYNDYLKLQTVFNQYEFWRFLQVWINEKVNLLENSPNKWRMTKKYK